MGKGTKHKLQHRNDLKQPYPCDTAPLTVIQLNLIQDTLGSLSKDVFERCTSTGSGLFASVGTGFTQIFFIRERTLSSTILSVLSHVKCKAASLPVDLGRSKTIFAKVSYFRFGLLPFGVRELAPGYRYKIVLYSYLEYISPGPTPCWNVRVARSY